MLLHGDGDVRLLRTQPDLLLGMQVATARHDRQVVLTPGSTLGLYTDGLVERKDEDLDDGLDRFVRAVARLQGSTPDQMCDALLDELASDADDDVALLVLQVT